MRASFGLVLLGVLISFSLLFSRPVFAAMPTLSQNTEITIAEGSTGPAVEAWQEQLDTIDSPNCSPYINVGPALPVDGVFGPSTLAATESFQRQTGLRVDGIVDPLTHFVMDNLISQKIDC